MDDNRSIPYLDVKYSIFRLTKFGVGKEKERFVSQVHHQIFGGKNGSERMAGKLQHQSKEIRFCYGAAGERGHTNN